MLDLSLVAMSLSWFVMCYEFELKINSYIYVMQLSKYIYVFNCRGLR